MLLMSEENFLEKQQGTWDLSDADFARFAGFIEQHSGLVFDGYKKDSLRISLTSRISLNRLQSYEDYYRLLSDPLRGPEEFRKLLSLITINETSFFRNPEQYTVLKKFILPAIAAKKDREGGNRTIRIWSAGCSTGEEPYSLAMVALEAGYIEKGWKVEILATDVSEQALEAARGGVYRRRSLLNMTQGQIDRFFTEKDGQFTVADEVRSLVTFDYFNLIRIPFPLQKVHGMDIIFCKNVTIYFKMESTRRVINNFHEALADCGYLFIGHAETLWGISDRYRTVEKEGAFFYMKGNGEEGCLLPGLRSRGDMKYRSEGRHKPSGARQDSNRPAGDLPPWQPRKSAESPPPSSDESAVPWKQKAVGHTDESAYAQCEILYREGKYDEAVACLDMLLLDDPRHLKALMLRAYVDANREDYEKAKTGCIEIIDIDPEFAEAYLLLGTIYGKYQQFDKALTTLKKAIYNNPFLVEAYVQTAAIHKELKQWDKAVLAFENAAHCLENHASSIVDGPGRELSHKILLDLCKGNIELLKAKGRKP